MDGRRLRAFPASCQHFPIATSDRPKGPSGRRPYREGILNAYPAYLACACLQHSCVTSCRAARCRGFLGRYFVPRSRRCQRRWCNNPGPSDQGPCRPVLRRRRRFAATAVDAGAAVPRELHRCCGTQAAVRRGSIRRHSHRRSLTPDGRAATLPSRRSPINSSAKPVVDATKAALTARNRARTAAREPSGTIA